MIKDHVKYVYCKNDLEILIFGPYQGKLLEKDKAVARPGNPRGGGLVVPWWAYCTLVDIGLWFSQKLGRGGGSPPAPPLETALKDD